VKNIARRSKLVRTPQVTGDLSNLISDYPVILNPGIDKKNCPLHEKGEATGGVEIVESARSKSDANGFLFV
jgi:hypothetical protein